MSLPRPDRLVEAEPDLPASPQGVVVVGGGREEGPEKQVTVLWCTELYCTVL